MNVYTKNLNRLEFLVTLACTGRCKHCSEGEHKNCGEHIDGNIAAEVVYKVAEKYSIHSLMTFGGEPLLHPDVVYKIHAAAQRMGIPKRQLITNGFFSKDSEKIYNIVERLAQSGVNDILLSVDAFHQETITIETVKIFAEAVKEVKIPVRTHPAWLVDKEAENDYNEKTSEIINEFISMGIMSSDGNVIFPSGNALKYLKEYFDLSKMQVSPYIENPEDIRALCVDPKGSVLNGNIKKSDIMDIIRAYIPR